MPTVRIESREAPTLEVKAPEGGSLADLCDEHQAAVPFSCRGASCGTCRIDVLEGMQELAEPEDEERSRRDDKPREDRERAGHRREAAAPAA